MNEIESDIKFVSKELGSPSGLGDRLATKNEGASGNANRVDLYRENIGAGFGATARGDFFAGVRDNDKAVSSFFSQDEVGAVAWGENVGVGFHKDRIGLAAGNEDIGASLVLNREAIFNGVQLENPAVQVRIKEVTFQYNDQGYTIRGDLKNLWRELAAHQSFMPDDTLKDSKFFSTFDALTNELNVTTSLQSNRAKISGKFSSDQYSLQTGYEIDIEKGSSSQLLTFHGKGPQGQFQARFPLNSDGPSLMLSPSATPHVTYTLSEKYQEAMYRREIKF